MKGVKAIIIAEHDVHSVLQRVIIRKVLGSEDISGHLLRCCAYQLAEVFTSILMSLWLNLWSLVVLKRMLFFMIYLLLQPCDHETRKLCEATFY